MKNTKILILLIISLTITISSCEKDEDEPTKKEILSDGMWTGISIISYIDGVLDETISITDYKFDFKTDGSLDFFVSNILEETGTWSINSDNTIITAYIEGETMLWSINTLVDESLVFSFATDNCEDVFTFER